MKKFGACALLLFASSVNAADPLLLGQRPATHVELNNRILAVVNETPISLYDVMKKMDFIFYRQFSEYSGSPEARHEFYRLNWKHVLNELIDKELIVADAKENKLPISNGDVRQEMESLFGPNIVNNLDKIGMSYDEARKIVTDDITIRRMLYVRVNNKAINSVTPGLIQQAYEEYCADAAASAQWHYFVVTIRDATPESANIAYRLLTEEEIEPSLLQEQLNDAKITVSARFTHSNKELASTYKEALAALEPHQFSQPQSQTSRATGQEVYRIFYLDHLENPNISSFSEMEQHLKEQITSKLMDQETIAYIKRLRSHYNVSMKEIEAGLSASYEPFFLQ